MGHLSGEHLYEIFARQKREDRLEHIGTVSAPNPALAPFEAVNRDEQPFTLSPAEAR